ncbi:NCS2 family permease [Candidatus Saccharibacteria bacterium]|nr:NCS2 family permease [Candidatus Saccharibacteria bacterium]
MSSRHTGSALERRFRFREHGTTAMRDGWAGVTTFLVMSYIIFVNPSILGFSGIEGLEDKGLPFGAVLTSTCLVAGVMTIVMGLYTNKAYAIAPGLGLNAFVAFTLVAGEGFGFPEAMGLIVIEGLAITLLVLMGLREAIMNAVPNDLKNAIAIGIGLFILLIGLTNAGVVVRGEGTPLDLAEFTTWPLLVALVGIALTLGLRAAGLRSALLLGILATTALATLINWVTGYDAGFTSGARWPGFDNMFDWPDFSIVGDISFDAYADDFIKALVFTFVLWISDFFDTIGTLIGVGRRAGYVDQHGRMDDVRRPLLVDSLAAVAGGVASSSSATTYIESAAGVEQGGRTGWVSVVTGALFFPFMFIAPLIGMVPKEATAAALVMVGVLMMQSLAGERQITDELGKLHTVLSIDLRDIAVASAAVLMFAMMPFSFSIADGIAFGFIAYVLARMFQGRGREIHPLMWGSTALFVLYLAVPVLRQHGWL